MKDKKFIVEHEETLIQQLITTLDCSNYSFASCIIAATINCQQGFSGFLCFSDLRINACTNTKRVVR